MKLSEMTVPDLFKLYGKRVYIFQGNRVESVVFCGIEIVNSTVPWIKMDFSYDEEIVLPKCREIKADLTNIYTDLSEVTKLLK